ncbi:hypothetical protein FA10DRAFT_262796 [Acaromyces ingoldii]|uniref:Uncharacterized protein n=1 Tax=Acaromyces ingoldii TaxID=215250 RepID=A0A316YCR2_9BASI|nr:hypothetical protein FA10DRAFT_262796 [Acaromyces ingoldii]PWN87009.1 hypothetical protein FA10DRAFT_262796 [Acaromyces ingoldii]
MARSSVLPLVLFAILFLLISSPSAAVERNHLERRARQKSKPTSSASFGFQQPQLPLQESEPGGDNSQSQLLLQQSEPGGDDLQPQLSQQQSKPGGESSSRPVALQPRIDERNSSNDDGPSAIGSSDYSPPSSRRPSKKGKEIDSAGGPPGQGKTSARRWSRSGKHRIYVHWWEKDVESLLHLKAFCEEEPSEKAIQELFDEVCARTGQTDGQIALTNREKENLTREAKFRFYHLCEKAYAKAGKVYRIAVGAQRLSTWTDEDKQALQKAEIDEKYKKSLLDRIEEAKCHSKMKRKKERKTPSRKKRKDESEG